MLFFLQKPKDLLSLQGLLVHKPQSDPQVSQRNLHAYFNKFFVELWVTFHKQYLVYNIVVFEIWYIQKHCC